jgi:glycosyltransferase involved in cell wall biosynthesis
VLVGLVARFHPMKDHRMFIRAAGILCRHQPDVHVVLAGAGVDASNGELRRMLAAEGIENRTALLGSRDDVARVDAALDVAVMASSGGEGFPTAIAEAMACGVPGVVTDVGDARRLVEGTGRVVAAGDARALADACRELVEASPADRQALGRAARVRILTQYSLATIVRAYQRLYASFAST